MMPHLCVVTGDDGPAPTIAVELSDEHGAVDLTEAFRLAKVCAGWEQRRDPGPIPFVESFVPYRERYLRG